VSAFRRTVQIDAPVTLRGLTRVLRAYERFVRQHAIPDQARIDMHIALEEIVSNVVRHGSGRGARRMAVTLTATRRSIQAVVEDDGPAFNPLIAAPRDMTRPVTKRPPGGLGLLLARQLTDCTYSRRRTGNRVRLKRAY
jgi:serine/threonine-protein kinase RsbW